jgi:hypothetical protein
VHPDPLIGRALFDRLLVSYRGCGTFSCVLSDCFMAAPREYCSPRLSLIRLLLWLLLFFLIVRGLAHFDLAGAVA